MKLTIERAALLRSLNHIQSVVERRNTIPILANVMVEANDTGVNLTATDMDISIVESAESTAAATGATTAPAHTLYDIVRKLPDGSQIELDSGGDSDRLTLSAGRSRFTLATLPTADFPTMSAGELPHSFAVPADDLRALVDRTRFAISTEETRYYLNGIYLHAVEIDSVPVLRAVATDGHRLARVEMPMPDGAAGMPGIIIPRKTVNELRKLIDECEGDVEISLSDTKIRFAFDGTVLTSKLIDGTFPDYEKVIPVNNDKLLEVDCRQFAEAVDRVATISTERSRSVKLEVTDNSLTLSASSPDAGSATEEIEVSYGKEALEIGFNSKYLLDIAQQVEGDVAQVLFADGASPTIVRDSADGSALYVLMPMRV
ncbi:MAG: DNA polymerase III subunit beta [Rhodospirillaceae bacterium]|jgi:DNA polymerase-3 subunit beta|nr:DNA polymerase III subunit beta [Rhodospirillaceae bacterium]MDD9914190.1 DNA polymerase III subunit beta [Rhodospirillaceae bacterium]MDD9927669.1 DNA polymerase III subunit beta [Rhodospirillaceae bacterium]|tara:strand:- start:140 stop:1258 length:1119 start_codon:yes stop_codon:yes gene_type:complete